MIEAQPLSRRVMMGSAVGLVVAIVFLYLPACAALVDGVII